LLQVSEEFAMTLSRLINIFKKIPSQSPFRKGRRGEMEVPKQTELEIINARLEKLEGDLGKAITGYKLMLIKENPDILADLIRGESIEEIDRSLSQAKELTNRIRTKLEEKITAEKIPAGAPTRLPPDLDSLSSEEKIRYGLQITNHK
jgi:hypothetical protein